LSPDFPYSYETFWYCSGSSPANGCTRLTEADILLFAAVTGDTNPMQLDAECAATSIFRERIAHGMLAT
jgi:3-hydroxybutyryl-CoA dehydratase